MSTPELQIRLKEGENYAAYRPVAETARFDNPERIITTDGLRVEYKDGFGSGPFIQYHADNRLTFRGGQLGRTEAYTERFQESDFTG